MKRFMMMAIGLMAAAACAAGKPPSAPPGPTAQEAASPARAASTPQEAASPARAASTPQEAASPPEPRAEVGADTGRSAPRPGIDWPSFHGPAAAGAADGFPLADRWNVAGSEGIRWKTPIPGLGHSSPVVWGDRIFLTSAVGPGDASLKVGLYGDIAPVPDEGEHRFIVYAIDKRSGAILWERAAYTGQPRVKRHTKSSHANPTPATDGRHLAVSFGSEGLYLYDVDGKLLWKKDLGILDAGYYLVPAAQWGFSSSPLIHEGLVIVQVDVQGGGYLAAFRLADGGEAWRTPRADVPTFGTPSVHGTGAGARVVVNGWKHIGGYEAATGREVWKMKGGGDIPVPTPVVAHDLVFITNAHGGPSPVYAIRTSASGEILSEEGTPAGPHVAWAVQRGGAYMQTPVAYGDHLYVCRDNGQLTVHAARTGEVLHTQRLGSASSGFTASGVAGDGKLYYASENGEVFVLRAGPQPEVIATNDMVETIMATPAVSEGTLLFRTRGHLVAVAPPANRPAPAGGALR